MSYKGEKARVPVFDGDPDHFDAWEIQFEAFAVVQGITDAFGTKLNDNMPADSTTVIDVDTDEGKQEAKAVRNNNEAMAFYAIALGKQMKLLRLLKKERAE